MGDLSQQVAFRVACAISGFPVEDAAYLIGVVRAVFDRDEATEGETEKSIAAREELQNYLIDFAGKREPNSPLAQAVDSLLVYGDDRGPFDLDLVGQHLSLLLVGATETFPKAFACGLRRLWQHPDQRRELVDNPSLIPKALQEILRYDMPTQWLGRTTIADHEIQGHKIRKGQPVIFLYPSANYDPAEFDDPETFDIHRNPGRILTFGTGTHRCLGAFMAQMEGRVLLEEVLRNFPEYEVLESELYWPPTEFVQGYQEFPIAFDPAG